MSAECRSVSNEPVWSELDLNTNIANCDGKLTPVGSNGNFALTCKDITIQDNHVLSAQCETKKDGNYVSTIYDLDLHVANINGELTWESSAMLPILRNYNRRNIRKETTALSSH